MTETIAQILLVKAYKAVKEKYPATRNAADFCRFLSHMISKNSKEVGETIEKCYQTYISSEFKKGNWKKLMKSTNINDELSRICKYKDHETKENRQYESYLDFCSREHFDLSPSDIEFVLINLGITFKSHLPSYLIPDKYFQTLEFENTGIEVNCITYSLTWAVKLLPNKLEKIRSNGNIYRYLLTERSSHMNFKMLEKIIKEEPQLQDQIQMRNLWELGKSPFEYCDLQFPIFNDIVIYRRKNEKGRYEIETGIIGIPPNIANPTEGYSILIEKERAVNIFQWFENAWDSINTG